MELIYFLKEEAATCGVENLEDFLKYAVMIIRVIQIIVPIALIIWGSIDLLKGLIAGDDKKIKEARKPFIQRLITAVLIFLIPWIVNYVITTFFTDGTGGWADCYSAAAEKADSKEEKKGIDPNPANYSSSSKTDK